MAKLYFRYGAMNSGKSTGLLQAAFNYEERDQRVLLAKPQVDTKGDDEIVSRLGVTRRVDFRIPPEADVVHLFRGHASGDDLLCEVARRLRAALRVEASCRVTFGRAPAVRYATTNRDAADTFKAGASDVLAESTPDVVHRIRGEVMRRYQDCRHRERRD